MTTPSSAGSLRRRTHRGLVAVAAGAVLFGVAGWQQVAQAAVDPVTGAEAAAEADVAVSFGPQQEAVIGTTDAAAADSVAAESPTPVAVDPGAADPGAAAPSTLASTSSPTSEAPIAVSSTATSDPAGSASAAADPSIQPGADSVTAGEPLPLLGSGLTPGSTVRIVVDDTTEIAVVEVNAAGDLRADVVIPADTVVGTHVISVLPVVTGPALRSGRAALVVAGATAEQAVASFQIMVTAPMPLLPPGGASSNTDGTTSSVSPGSVAIGSTLSFTVGGYPAGETLYVKIDDGSYTGTAAQSGAGVVTTATIGSGGTASGSLTVPADLALGSHTLRFLASQKTSAGTLGFTHLSDTFVVVAAASGSQSVSSAGSQSSSSSAAGSQSSSSSSAGSSSSSATAVAGSGGSGSGSSNALAQTGVDPAIGMAAGLGFMLAGAGMVVAARRNGQDGAANHA